MSASELRHEHVLNPAMGLRAIRWSLAEPSMFRQQLRAIYRASAYGKVRLLIPMVAHLSEVRQILESVKKVQQQLTDAGHAFTKVDLGVMIEIPAAAVMLPLLLRHLDFVSIGTNDLIQYTLAIDRADEAVAHLYDPWHPAVLQLLAAQSRRRAPQASRSASAARWRATQPSPTCCSRWACAASPCTRRRSRRSNNVFCVPTPRDWRAVCPRSLEVKTRNAAPNWRSPHTEDASKLQ